MRSIAMGLLALLLGCTPQHSDYEKASERKATEASPDSMVCKGYGDRHAEVRYFVIDEVNHDLLKWDDERGAPVSVCLNWGSGCAVSIYPKRVEVIAAKSAEQRYKIDLYRDKGLIVEDEDDFRKVSVFTGMCRKGTLPRVNASKLML